MIFLIIVAFIFFLCWGSFLNVVGYRIIRGYPLTGRSLCPHCRHILSWYDLIPFISWVMLQGRCRYCKNRISILYPFIELLTALVLTTMILFIPQQFWLAYGLCISALIVTIRTDFEKMLISRYLTWGLIPIAFILSLFKMLPLTPSECLLGTFFGYVLLWLTARIFYYFKNIEGMGDGDIDLLAMIGAFTGITGAWISLLLGSFYGLLASGSQFLFKGRFLRKIAFGPWLAAGAITYIFFSKQIIKLIYPIDI